MTYPKVEIVEEGPREGFQIESAAIAPTAKVRLIDALSGTGLRTIVVGSFVSPRWTPQMANIDEIVETFTPRPGVTYRAVVMNDRGVQRMQKYVPPLEPVAPVGRTAVHLCDVFVRRNGNRSQDNEIARWDDAVRRGVANQVREAEIGLGAAWGSNWCGMFDEAHRMQMLERQYDLWQAAGVPVTRIWLADPMAWNLPHHVESQIRAVQARWPEIRRWHLHLHNARGSALLSAYAALRCLSEDDTLVLDASVGGMGGCPYGGHGRATRMIPTEDLVDLLEELGIDTGVDLDALVEASHLAETIVGHELWGHVSKAGPRPRGERLYDMAMPLIETFEQAQHFRRGPAVYADAPSPWREPITSPMRSS